MTGDAGTPPHDAPAHEPPRRIASILLWGGAFACMAGFVTYRLWDAWRPGRFGELVLVAGIAAGLAALLRRVSGIATATAIAAVLLVALACFAGPMPVLATVALALACAALGGAVVGRAPLALQCACGCALLAGVLGWLLPLPLHGRWTYALLCVALVAWRHRALRESLREARAQWTQATAAHPRAAAWAVIALGLAATACWLPTLQVDDLGYHLRLPWEVQLQGRYRPDPWLHVWAVAPWASDVQHAFVQLLAGTEARGALNALWIAITAAGVWRLARALGASALVAWTAVALYASLPLTAALAAGMQTENAAAALTAWCAWLVLRRADETPRMRGLLAGALLVGGLAGLKLMSGAQALLLVAWAGWVHRRSFPFVRIAPACVLALGVAGSSYAYGAWVAGNPFLPLFNEWFGSPYAPASAFADTRWHVGWTPMLPWRLTFDTARYYEGFAGAAGFALVALAGAWIAALADRRTRGLALVATVGLALTLLPLQYLRYAFPMLVLLVPCIAVAAVRLHPRHGMRLLVATCALNFAFQANAHWMLRTGALKQAVLASGADAPLFAKYAPVRNLLPALREAARGNVLLADAERPLIAELGSRGRGVSWYSPRLQGEARIADRDGSGAAWSRILRTHGITDVLVPATLPEQGALSAALRRMEARSEGRSGDVVWWRLPERPVR